MKWGIPKSCSLAEEQWEANYASAWAFPVIQSSCQHHNTNRTAVSFN